jgi:nitrogen-specific signal transduction histidine kinase
MSHTVPHATSPAPLVRQEDRPAAPVSEETVLLACFPEACFVLDPEGHITFINPAAEKLLEQLSGALPGPLLGRNIRQACPEMADSTFIRQCKDAQERQQLVENEAFYPTLKRWFNVLVWPRENRLCVVFQDVSERVRLQRELAQRKEQGEEERAQDLFVEQLVQEVQTALISIREVLQAVAQGELDQQAQRTWDLADLQVRALSDRLAHMLRASPFAVATQPSEVNLTTMIAQVLAQASEEAGRCSFVVDFPPDPLSLDADPKQLGLALRLLLSCASRSNDPNDTLRLTIERHGTEIVLRVRPDCSRQATPSASPVDVSRRG